MARYIVSSLLVACGLFGLAEQAGAVAIGAMLAGPHPAPLASAERMPAVFRAPETESCNVAAAALPAQLGNAGFASASGLAAASVSSSKASAILGGAVSALDRIRLDQAAQASGGAAVVQANDLTMLARPGEAVPVGARIVPGAGLAPGAAPLSMARSVPAGAGAGCTGFVLPRAVIAVAPGRGSGFSPEDFLQTKRLVVSHTAFDRQWARVSQQGLSSRFVMQDATLSRFARGRATMATVEAVNAWTNRKVRFAEDDKLYGTADYWAPAQMTLKRGAGDCEDIAIAKMQILAAMGVARSDMYLTIARDLARHADHALLVVRIDDRYWLLDNSTDRVLDANASYDYQPVLSFSEGRKWLHGAVLARAD